MKVSVMGVGELKTNFSQVLKRVQAGEEIDIIYGKSKEIVATIVPKKAVKPLRRKLGIMDNKVKIRFSKNFEISADEFLGL